MLWNYKCMGERHSPLFVYHNYIQGQVLFNRPPLAPPYQGGELQAGSILQIEPKY